MDEMVAARANVRVDIERGVITVDLGRQMLRGQLRTRRGGAGSRRGAGGAGPEEQREDAEQVDDQPAVMAPEASQSRDQRRALMGLSHVAQLPSRRLLREDLDCEDAKNAKGGAARWPPVRRDDHFVRVEPQRRADLSPWTYSKIHTRPCPSPAASQRPLAESAKRFVSRRRLRTGLENCPDFMSHTLIVLSSEPETMRPSAVTATAFTGLCALPAQPSARQLPDLDRLVPEPETMRPSADSATEHLSCAPRCAAGARRQSQTLTVRPEPETMRPSAVSATASTSRCALPGSAAGRPLSRSHTLRVLSPEPETMRPSGVSATAMHPVGVPFEGAQQAPALQVPHLDRVVV